MMSARAKFLVVGTVIGGLILAWLMIMPGSHGAPEARIMAIRADIIALHTAFDAFEVDCRRYPTTAEGLSALISQPTNLPSWRGPYLKDITAQPLDPWGHRYVYVCPGVHNTNGIDLYSCGPDGISRSGGDDPDDINNWSEVPKAR